MTDIMKEVDAVEKSAKRLIKSVSPQGICISDGEMFDFTSITEDIAQVAEFVLAAIPLLERVERLEEALNYILILSDLYVGDDFTKQHSADDFTHVRDILRQMVGCAESHLALTQPTKGEK